MPNEASMPSTKTDLRVVRVEDAWGRELALAVMRAIYRDEKNWIQNDEKLVSAADLADDKASWFVVCVENSFPLNRLRPP